MILLTLLAGLLLSGTAAYYSIIGLLAIFPGAILPITIMGSSLEFAKLVAVSWLYRNWSDAPRVIKAYFIFAVLILMFITSLGTFGYLSKVHLETSMNVSDNSVEISRLESELSSERQQITNAQKSVDILDKIVSQTQDPIEANRIRTRQISERNELKKIISNSSNKASAINTQLAPLRITNLRTEAEIGPLKYVAELIYGEEADSHFDSAVRFVIILIVLVFDPLAVLLLIAANISMMQKKKPKEETAPPKQPKTPKVKKVAKVKDSEYNKGIKGSIYKFMMKDDFGMKAVDKIDTKDTE